MNGVAAVRSVLVADAALTAIVPAARIMAGALPLGVVLPAVSLSSVSSVDQNLLKPGATRFVTERVRATVYAANYPGQRETLAAVKRAAADRLNVSVAGISGVSIHTDGAGADFLSEDASIHVGSIDLLVKYTETR